MCCQSFAEFNFWLPQDVLWQQDQKVHYMFWGKFFVLSILCLHLNIIKETLLFQRRKAKYTLFLTVLEALSGYFSWTEYLILTFFLFSVSNCIILLFIDYFVSQKVKQTGAYIKWLILMCPFQHIPFSYEVWFSQSDPVLHWKHKIPGFLLCFF